MNDKILLILFCSLTANAELRFSHNGFWGAAYKTSRPVEMRLLTAAAVTDCENFEKSFSQPESFSASDLLIARSAPLETGRRHYRVEFSLISILQKPVEKYSIDEQLFSELSPLVFFESEPKLKVSLNHIIDIKLFEAGPLTLLTRRLGLPAAGYELLPGGNGTERRLLVYARDLACDLLKGKSQLHLRSPYEIVLSAKTMRQIDFFYSQHVNMVQEIFRLESDQIERALKIGAVFGQTLYAEGADERKFAATLALMYDRFFQVHRLEFNQNWLWSPPQRSLLFDKVILTEPYWSPLQYQEGL